jgi:hypothetical protein
MPLTSTPPIPKRATSPPSDGMDSSSDLVGIDVPKSVDIDFEKEES